MQVYMTKKPELEKYTIDLSKYDNIIIGSPCWFGTNEIKDKNIFLFVCNDGNMRNTWKNYEKTLRGNKIVSKIDFVYPVKNGIEEAKNKAKEWIVGYLK